MDMTLSGCRGPPEGSQRLLTDSHPPFLCNRPLLQEEQETNGKKAEWDGKKFHSTCQWPSVGSGCLTCLPGKSYEVAARISRKERHTQLIFVIVMG